MPTGPTIDLSDVSVLNNTIVTWTLDSIPDTTQIWRSKNGAAFVQIGTVAGAITAFTDADAMPNGDQWAYKVRTVTGGTPGTFSSTVSAGSQLGFSAQVNASFPDLVLCYNGFIGAGSATLVSLSAPILRRVYASTDLSGSGFLASVNLPLLVRTVNLNLNGCACASLTFPQLTMVLGSFDGGLAPNLTSITFTSSPNFVLGFATEFSAALTTISLFNSTFADGCFMPCDVCALNQPSVDAVLRRGVVSVLTTSTIDLSGGTSSTPSAAGLADKATLIGNGCTVITN